MASFSGAMAMDFEEIPLAYDNPEESVKAGPSWGRSGHTAIPECQPSKSGTTNFHVNSFISYQDKLIL